MKCKECKDILKISANPVLSGILGKFTRTWYSGSIVVTEQEIRQLITGINNHGKCRHCIKKKTLLINPYKR